MTVSETEAEVSLKGFGTEFCFVDVTSSSIVLSSAGTALNGTKALRAKVSVQFISAKKF